MHPGWYYDLYDEIFGWSRDYPKEISIINDIVPLRDKIVEEIGSGTGMHTEQILKMNPYKVEAIDCDIQAIDLLKEKFKYASNIQIINGDGFARKHTADVIICLYSILQQTEEKAVLSKRIDNLLNGIKTNDCHIFIECIDTTKHKEHGLKYLYNSGQDYVGIRSEKTDYGVKIIYQGTIKNMNVFYEVPLCYCPLHLFEINSNIQYEIIPLNQSGRKRIIHLFKR